MHGTEKKEPAEKEQGVKYKLNKLKGSHLVSYIKFISFPNHMDKGRYVNHKQWDSITTHSILNWIKKQRVGDD